jgi:hypothetical protein
MTWRGSASPDPEPYEAAAGETQRDQTVPTGRRPARIRRRPLVDARRLWTGGVATAVVAIGITIVGFLIIRGLLHLPVLGIWPQGPVSHPSMTGYAGVAALSALLATGVMHLLLVSTPRPRFFFAWISVLCTAMWVILPLTVPDQLGVRLATAALNLVIGVTITVIIHGMAAYASRGGGQLPPAPSYYDET